MFKTNEKKPGECGLTSNECVVSVLVFPVVSLGLRVSLYVSWDFHRAITASHTGVLRLKHEQYQAHNLFSVGCAATYGHTLHHGTLTT